MRYNFWEFLQAIGSELRNRGYRGELKEDGMLGVKTVHMLMGNSNCEPVLRMEPVYEDYLRRFKERKDNSVIMDIADEIIRTYNEAKKDETPQKILDAFTERMENWQDYILCRPIIVCGNEDYLADKLYKIENDYAVIYYIPIFEDKDQIGTVVVKKDMIDDTIENIDKYARENTKKNTTVVTESISKVLAETMGLTEEEFIQTFHGDIDVPTYVVTSEKSKFGAVTILFNELLDKVCEQLNSDEIYILPSSTMELLALPKNEWTANPIRLMEMVRQVNETQLEQKDRLSNNAYYYNKNKGTLINIATMGIDE